MNLTRIWVRLRLRHCHSARDRDTRLEAMMLKLREHLNIAVAHAAGSAHSEGWLLAVTAAAGHQASYETLERFVEALHAHPDCEVVGTPDLKTLPAT